MFIFYPNYFTRTLLDQYECLPTSQLPELKSAIPTAVQSMYIILYYFTRILFDKYEQFPKSHLPELESAIPTAVQGTYIILYSTIYIEYISYTLLNNIYRYSLPTSQMPKFESAIPTAVQNIHTHIIYFTMISAHLPYRTYKLI